MGRMHSKGKGISKSALPYKRSPPSWLKITTAEVRRSHFDETVSGAMPWVLLKDEKVSLLHLLDNLVNPIRHDS